MKRARTLLVSLLLAVSTLGATAQVTFAHRSDIWTNSDSFTSRCLGFTDTYPQQLYNLASAQMSRLGYMPNGGAMGVGFTKSAFFATILPDYGVYAHTHGDPNIDSAILQDPGPTRCSDYTVDSIRSSAIKAATAGAFYNLVIMSTCKLGSSSSTMPGAFQIAMVKNATRHEFYLGYVNYTYDSDSLRFEQAFWSYLNGESNHRRTLYQAFTYALSIGGYSAPDAADPFQANWWGNPNYNGVPG
jgi:hypothetical protein